MSNSPWNDLPTPGGFGTPTADDDTVGFGQGSFGTPVADDDDTVGFGQVGFNSTETKAVRAPGRPSISLAHGWLLVAVGLLVASALLWRHDTFRSHVVGYLLAGIGATTALAIHRVQEVGRRADRNYARHAGPSAIAAVATLLVAVLIVAHVWPLANELAR